MVEKQMKMASLLFLLNYRLIYPQCLFLKTDSFISRIKIKNWIKSGRKNPLKSEVFGRCDKSRTTKKQHKKQTYFHHIPNVHTSGRHDTDL